MDRHGGLDWMLSRSFNPIALSFAVIISNQKVRCAIVIMGLDFYCDLSSIYRALNRPMPSVLSLLFVQCGVQGDDQGLDAERLVQEANSSRPQHPLPCLFVAVSRDE